MKAFCCSWVAFIAFLFFLQPCEAALRPSKNVTKSTKKEVPPRASSALVIIDPGHGGSEEGTHANHPTPYCEKELTLATAKYLESYLQRLGHRTLMTRYRDITVTLQERSLFANKKLADLFVSVHYNWAPSPQASGVEVFFFRGGDATREQASEKLARYVLDGVVAMTATVSRGVKHGNFSVIRETSMPAVLVESGFLSNPAERKRLLDSQYQRHVARGIALGIDHFLRERQLRAMP